MAGGGQAEWVGGEWRRVESGERRSRVIDAHLHTFPRLGTATGGQSAGLQIRLWQHHLRFYRPYFRRDDGSRVYEPLLDYPSDDIDDMPDVNFRLSNFGQADFTVDGVDYYVQLYPPSLVNMEVPPERVIAEMDLLGVHIGVLQHDHIYGSLNEYFGECMRRFPGRFIGLAQIREWEADQEAEHERLERAILEHGNRGLYFSVGALALGHDADQHLDDPRYEPLWDVVRRLEIPVWWWLDSRRRDRFDSFMQRVSELNRWAQAHPDIPAVITHGLVPVIFFHDVGIPDEMMALLKLPNVHAEVNFHTYWPEYPYVEGRELIKRLCGEVGVEKLMWGSDMPFCVVWCTYKQSLDYIRLHWDFLSDGERDLIVGGNVARLFGMEAYE